MTDKPMIDSAPATKPSIDDGAAAAAASEQQTPMRRFAGVALAVVSTMAGALLLWEFRPVLLLLVAALVLAATIRPMSEWLAAHGLWRGFATTLLVLLVVVGLLLLIGLSGYVLAEDLPRAATDIQMRYAQVRNTLVDQSGWRGAVGAQLPPPQALEEIVATQPLEAATGVEPEILLAPATAEPAPTPAPTMAESPSQPSAQVPEQVTAPDSDTSPAVTSQERVSGMLRLFVGTTSSLLGLFAQFIVLVFLSLYWSLESDWFERLWLSLLPAERRRRARTAWHDLEDGVGAHVRSELVQLILAFVLLYIGFRLIGLEYAMLMAWAAGLAWMIPLVGGLAALVPVVVLALLGSPLMAVGAALYTVLVLVLLEFGVEPRLDQRRRAGSILGLIVTLVMLQALGVVGLIVASPIAVAAETLVAQWQAPAAKVAPASRSDDVEQLGAQMAELRAAMGKADVEIPHRTRSLYERLQTLMIDAEKSL